VGTPFPTTSVNHSTVELTGICCAAQASRRQRTREKTHRIVEVPEASAAIVVRWHRSSTPTRGFYRRKLYQDLTSAGVRPLKRMPAVRESHRQGSQTNREMPT
jgi:hypothetical protein